MIKPNTNKKIFDSLENSAFKVLLILNKGHDQDLKVLVKLHTKSIISEVKMLMSEDKKREAFELIVSQGQVMDYIPAGKRLKVKPEYTLVEDIL